MEPRHPRGGHLGQLIPRKARTAERIAAIPQATSRWNYGLGIMVAAAVLLAFVVVGAALNARIDDPRGTSSMGAVLVVAAVVLAVVRARRTAIWKVAAAAGIAQLAALMWMLTAGIGYAPVVAMINLTLTAGWVASALLLRDAG